MNLKNSSPASSVEADRQPSAMTLSMALLVLGSVENFWIPDSPAYRTDSSLNRGMSGYNVLVASACRQIKRALGAFSDFQSVASTGSQVGSPSSAIANNSQPNN